MSKKKLIPQDRCANCQRKLSEIGGRRISINHDRYDDYFDNLQYKKQLAKKQGKIAWLCQDCLKITCHECGSPVCSPMGRDVLYDSGNSTHVAVFPSHPQCVNKNCKYFAKTAYENCSDIISFICK